MRLVAFATIGALLCLVPAVAQDSAPKAGQKPAAKPDDKAAPKAKAGEKAAPKADDKAAAKDKKSTKKKAAKKDKEPGAAPTAATQAQKDALAALPASERLAIQSDLIWSGDLTGSLDPEATDRTVAAIRSFQRRNAMEDSGILAPDQRQTLASSSRNRKDYFGWRLVEDTVTPGVRVGIPAKLLPQSEIGATGSRWSSARGEIQIETFREKMAGASLNDLFDDMKRKPSTRRVEYNSISGNSFALAGLQGLKKFHVRVYLRDNEARGLTILYDQAMEGIMLPMVDTMVNAYLPFGDAATASNARRVQYGSGIAVTQNGHVITERQLTDTCDGILVAGHGRAERIADDKASDLALLRVNGATNLKPILFSNDAPKSGDLTLVGIAEPESQAGARNVTTATARLRGIDGPRVLLDTTPARGFVGGAVVDGQGQLAGMIDVTAATTAGPPANVATAFIPTATIRKFLDGAGVYPASGKSDLAAARNAVVRVICVRR